jgi:hypothetical protein
MQELPDSVREMVGSVYAMLMKGKEEKSSSEDLLPNATNIAEDVAAIHAAIEQSAALQKERATCPSFMPS